MMSRFLSKQSSFLSDLVRHGRSDLAMRSLSWRLGPMLLAVAVCSMAAGVVRADPIFDTRRIIGHNGTECIGSAAGDCQKFQTRWTRVVKGASRQVAVRCPAAYPYVQGWDAKHHEHIEIVLLPLPFPDETTLADGRLRAVTVAAINKSDAAGSFRIYLGCSAKPFRGNGFKIASRASPSKPLRRSQP